MDAVQIIRSHTARPWRAVGSGWDAALVEPQPSLLQADVSLLANHKVIEHLDVERLSRLDETASDQDILMAYVEDTARAHAWDCLVGMVRSKQRVGKYGDLDQDKDSPPAT